MFEPSLEAGNLRLPHRGFGLDFAPDVLRRGEERAQMRVGLDCSYAELLCDRRVASSPASLIHKQRTLGG